MGRTSVNMPYSPNDELVRDYAELQLRRHVLILEGEEAQPLDQLEDQMSELWENLDDISRQRLNGMASDLNWIRRKGQPAPKARPAEMVATEERKELLATRMQEDWPKFLHFLRICAPSIPTVNLAYLRAGAYDASGLPKYAAVFYEFAAECDPANAAIGVIALRTLDRVNHAAALTRAAQIVASPLSVPPVVVALSIVMLLRRDEVEGVAVDRQGYEEILQEAIERLGLEPPSDVGQAMTFQLAASAFEILGDSASALRCYEAGLKLSPDNELLLVGKGMALYGIQTNKAVAAFQRVVSNEGSSLVWPYFFLAHHSLLQQNYAESLRMGKLARERATSNVVRAELLGWQAICLSESGYPADVVRPLFERALLLDPANERLQRNLTAFTESLSTDEQLLWDMASEDSLRSDKAPKMSELEPVA